MPTDWPFRIIHGVLSLSGDILRAWKSPCLDMSLHLRNIIFFKLAIFGIVRPTGQQKLNGLSVIALLRKVQRGLSLLINNIDLSPGLDQYPANFSLAFSGSIEQRGLINLILLVHIGLQLNHSADTVFLPVSTSIENGTLVEGIPLVKVSPLSAK